MEMKVNEETSYEENYSKGEKCCEKIRKILLLREAKRPIRFK